MKKFFIIGSQRSGTALMRLIMNSHPDIRCYGEVRAYKTLEEGLPLPNDKKWVGFQVPIWTELFVEYENIRKHFNDTPYCQQDKYLFMLRDYRAVVASMKKLGAFLTREAVGGVDKWMVDPNRSFAKRYSHILEEYAGHPLEHIAKAAIYWRYKTSTYLALDGWSGLGDKITHRMMPIHYEELVSNPKQKLQQVLEFLELDWDDRVLQHHTLNHPETLRGYALGQTKVARPIDTDSVFLWHKVLAEEEIALLDKLCQPLYEKILAATRRFEELSTTQPTSDKSMPCGTTFMDGVAGA